MIRIRKGEVIEILKEENSIIFIKVLVEGEVKKAIHDSRIAGSIKVGQKVILNTTAESLNLGTGGYHFVQYVEGNDHLDPDSLGHIMKLRYTPYQIKVLSVEEEESPHHQLFKDIDTLDKMPVVVAPLHSMVTPIVAVIKALRPKARIAYLMSDGGALPLRISQLVTNLRKRGWLDGTITFGHAFGGDFEAVNVYTGLLTARWVIEADVAVIAMGPGIVGTNTPYGFSGVEQAHFLQAVKLLNGEPIAVPRISFADLRPRHQGISHHSLTVLGKLTLVKTRIAIPELIGEKDQILKEQLIRSGIVKKHLISYHSFDEVDQILKEDGLKLRTMGREYSEDREFFLTAGLAGMLTLFR